MIRLYRHRDRFIQCSEKAFSVFANSGAGGIVNAGGTLNYIWNLWNLFWREYFMLYAIGGYDCARNRIVGSNRSLNQSQVASLCARIKKGQAYHNEQIPYYLELTWGDPLIIQTLLSSPIVPPGTSHFVTPMIALYSAEIKDFQQIRNAFIHMNSYGFAELEQNVLPRYRLAPGQTTLDILNSVSLVSGHQCLRSLVDAMNGCLLQL